LKIDLSPIGQKVLGKLAWIRESFADKETRSFHVKGITFDLLFYTFDLLTGGNQSRPKLSIYLGT